MVKKDDQRDNSLLPNDVFALKNFVRLKTNNNFANDMSVSSARVQTMSDTQGLGRPVRARGSGTHLYIYLTKFITPND